ATDKAPASGSGKNVQLPSSDEYDSWVTGLQLGGAAANAPDDTGFDPASGPFGASSASFDDADPFAGSSFGSGPFNQGLEDLQDAPAEPSGKSLFEDFGGSSAPAFRDKPLAAPGGMDDSDPFGGSTFGSKPEP